MGTGVEPARKDLGLTRKDMTDLRAARRRNGLAVILAGALGVVAGAVTGSVAGVIVNSGNDDYPYVLPAAAGLVGAASKKPKAGMVVAAVVGFLVTFVLFGLAMQTVSMYAVWHTDRTVSDPY